MCITKVGMQVLWTGLLMVHGEQTAGVSRREAGQALGTYVRMGTLTGVCQ